VYALPVTSLSTPIAVIPIAGGEMAVGPDGTLAVATASETVTIYAPPAYQASAPTARFDATGSSLAFDPSGNLYVSTSNSIALFQPPFTNGSVPAVAAVALTYEPHEFAFDPSGALYAVDNQLQVSAPPYAIPAVTVQTCVSCGYVAANGQLVAASAFTFGSLNMSTPGQVYIYQPPLTNTSSPIATIPYNPNPGPIALDQYGNLYDSAGNVYAPPFSANSTPFAVLNEGGTLAIGK